MRGEILEALSYLRVVLRGKKFRLDCGDYSTPFHPWTNTAVFLADGRVSATTAICRGGKMKNSSARYVEVCDLPYCSEPDLFYQVRMGAGLRVRELRESACRLFEKQNDQLTVRDLKLAFLKLYPVKVNLGGDDHEVTVKKLSGRWILSCNCRSWIFNLSGDRRCKHTEHVENLMTRQEEGWGRQ